VLELARCEYLARRENLIAIGNAGTGKTTSRWAGGLPKGLALGFTTAAIVHEPIEALTRSVCCGRNASSPRARC